MFTGIIEAAVPVSQVHDTAGVRRLGLELASLAGVASLKLGDSVAINGCCLTVAALTGTIATFEAVPQTLRLTNLGAVKVGDYVNVERAMQAGARLDGHLVQGHVDATGQVTEITENGGEWRVRIDCGAVFARQCIERGSVCVDGVSLTIAELHAGAFTVAVIPHTRKVTTIGRWTAGTAVNLEADVIGKYVRRQLEQIAPGGVTAELLRKAGFTP